MDIGIIVVTYNSQNDISRLLDSLAIQTYKDFTVYLVDNYSNDQTLQEVQKFLSRLSIQVIATQENNGYAKGNNIGIQKAMEDGCDFVFILNPDMKLDMNCIDKLFTRIKSEENIGVIGPIVLYGDNYDDNIIQSYGINANFKTQRKINPFDNIKLTNDIAMQNYVDYAHGGAMMFRGEVLKITGLFEEDYFMYNDELDISYRIKKAGFKVLCLREAKAWHFHDFDNKNKKGYNLLYYYGIRNRYLYFKKYHFYANLFLSLLKDFITLPVKIAWALRLENIRMLKFYYIGLIDGLLGKKGFSNKSFK